MHRGAKDEITLGGREMQGDVVTTPGVVNADSGAESKFGENVNGHANPAREICENAEVSHTDLLRSRGSARVIS